MTEHPTITEVSGQAPALAEHLHGAGLPVDDLSEPGRRFFRFDDLRQGLIGFIGWECAGDEEVALLRSLVVVPARRGRGWGRQMITWALSQLAASGVRRAYLLTTSIVPMAEALGFRPVDRASAPAAIRTSRQYVTLCPATAVLLGRNLP